MSFIISRGYAEVQILKTSESDPRSFWYASVQILKRVKLKRTLHILVCQKSADTPRYHIFVCNIGIGHITFSYVT